MFKQNEKYCQKLFQICDVKWKSRNSCNALFCILSSLFYCACLIRLTKRFYSSSALRCTIGLYVSVLIPVFGVRCPEHISGMFTDKLFVLLILGLHKNQNILRCDGKEQKQTYMAFLKRNQVSKSFTVTLLFNLMQHLGRLK